MKPSKSFNGVRYNYNKVDSDKGELMCLENFHSFLNTNSSKEDVKDYLQAISKMGNVSKPQFHAIISTKFQQHDKNELMDIGKSFMDKMGYGEQPYLVVFHSDTENNHIHIVSTRVDKYSGKKISDSFENIRSQFVLQTIMEEKYGEGLDDKLDKLLKYNYTTINQLQLLLENNGFKTNLENSQLSVIKYGRTLKKISTDELNFWNKENKANNDRKHQIKAILLKYKELASSKVFKIIDNREKESLEKISFDSELQDKIKKAFGIDIIFHYKDDKQPFGFTLIDNKRQSIYKGSDIIKMSDLFEFTGEELNKKDFERIKDYNIRTENERTVLKEYFKSKGIFLKDYMLYLNNKYKNKNSEFRNVKKDIIDKTEGKKDVEGVTIVKGNDGIFYAVHEKYHHIHKVNNIIGREYKAPLSDKHDVTIADNIDNIVENVMGIADELLKKSYTQGEMGEHERKKKKRRI